CSISSYYADWLAFMLLSFAGGNKLADLEGGYGNKKITYITPLKVKKKHIAMGTFSLVVVGGGGGASTEIFLVDPHEDFDLGSTESACINQVKDEMIVLMWTKKYVLMIPTLEDTLDQFLLLICHQTMIFWLPKRKKKGVLSILYACHVTGFDISGHVVFLVQKKKDAQQYIYRG
ncbi:hypothetical protein ACJX0J_027618, partial [Zea mays]